MTSFLRRIQPELIRTILDHQRLPASRPDRQASPSIQSAIRAPAAIPGCRHDRRPLPAPQSPAAMPTAKDADLARRRCHAGAVCQTTIKAPDCQPQGGPLRGLETRNLAGAARRTHAITE